MSILHASWVLILLLAAPATASGTLQAGPVEVFLRNGHDADCLDPSGLCLASATGSDPGELALDARQDVAFVGARVDDGDLEDALGVELLPDGGLVLDSSRFLVRHGVFRFYVENVGTLRAPAPLSAFAIVMTEETYGVDYYGPPLQDPTGPLGARSNPHDFNDDGIGYESVGPFSEMGNTSTDEYANDSLTFACGPLRSGECERSQTQLAASVARASPNVVVGLSFYQVGLGPPPEDQPLGARALRGPVDPARVLPGSPTTRLTFEPTPSRLSAFVPQGSPLLGPSGPRTPHPSAESLTAAAASMARTHGSPPPLALAAAAIALALAAAAFYSRVTRREEALLNARRLSILTLLAENGPLPFAEIGRRLDVDRTTVEHHTRLLRRTDHVRLERIGRHLYVALPGQALPQDRVGAGNAGEAILDILRRHGGVLPRAQVQRAAAQYPTRSRNEALRRLAAAGHIERAFAGPTEMIRLRGSR